MANGMARGTLRRLIGGAAYGGVLLALIGAACILLSGWMIRGVEILWGGTTRAQNMGTTGQYFDAVGAMFSGFALTLAIVATLLQRRELREQREELALQRRAQEEQNQHLHISAEANIRSLHMKLLQMAIEDPTLAEVWPGGKRQHLYANLIYAHIFLHYQLRLRSDEELRRYMRNLGRSPIFREYWLAGAEGRSILDPESSEARFIALVDEVLSGEPPPDEGEPEHVA